MSKRVLLAALAMLLLAAVARADEDEAPLLGWGARVANAGTMRADVLDCAATAIVRSGRFRLTVLPAPATRDDFVRALRAGKLDEGLWVEFIPLGRRVLLSLLRIEAKTGLVKAQRLEPIDEVENRPCDLAYRLTWELAEKPLDPAAKKFIDQARAACRYLEADDLYRKALIVSDHAYVACREAGMMWESGGWIDTARKWYALALARNPHDFLTLTHLARLDEQAGHVNEALDEYERAVFYGPRLISRLMDLARLYLRHQRPVDAQRILTEVLGLDPNNYPALGEMVRVAEANEDWPTAAAALRRLIEHGLAGDEYRRELATFYLNAHDYASAVEVLADLLQRDPWNADLLRDYARANLELGNYDLAETTLLRLLTRKPDDLQALRDLAQIYYQSHRFVEALNVLRRAALLAPYDLAVQRLLGKAYELAGDPSNALLTYEMLLRRSNPLASDDLDRYVGLARTMQQLDRARLLLNDLFRLTRGDRARELVALTLGRLEEQTGRLDAAISIYQRDLAVTSNAAQVHFELGRLMLQRGDVGGAMDHFRRMDLRGADPRLMLVGARMMKKARQAAYATELFGRAYYRDKTQTIAGLLFLEGQMLAGRDEGNHRLLYELDQTVVVDAEREQLLWLELFFAAENHFADFYGQTRQFALFFIGKRPQTLVDLSMWDAVVRQRIAGPAQAELLDLLRVFARKMPVADFAAKHHVASLQP